MRSLKVGQAKPFISALLRSSLLLSDHDGTLSRRDIPMFLTLQPAVLLLLFAFLSLFSFVAGIDANDPNAFTLLTGDLTTGSAPVFANFGIRTVFSPNDHPGGVMCHASFIRNSHLWLWGGYGNGATETAVRSNSMWEFSPSQKQWRYWCGDPNGGIQKNPKPGQFHHWNSPGSWSSGASFFDPVRDILYIFAGKMSLPSSTLLNNLLWAYRPADNAWKLLINNEKLTHFGTTGEYDPMNRPPRSYSWTNYGTRELTKDNSAFIFGAYQCNASDPEYGFQEGNTNDLWELDLSGDVSAGSIPQWRFVKGTKSVVALLGVDYGTKGTFNGTNMPPRRRSHCIWYTSWDHRVWVYGGVRVSPDTAYYGDLWAFDIVLGMWGWISGREGVDVAAKSVKDFTYSASNEPGSGSGFAYWLHGRYLFLMGGHSYIYNHGQVDYAAVWTYSFTLDQWKFSWGFAGEYVNSASPARPGSKDNAVAVVDTSSEVNRAYITFGSSYNDAGYDIYTNDVWEVQLFDCYGTYQGDASVCSNSHGKCEGPDLCVCNTETDSTEKLYDGDRCETSLEESSSAVAVGLSLGLVCGTIVILVIIAIVIVVVFVCVRTSRKMKRQKVKLDLLDSLGGDMLLEEAQAEREMSLTGRSSAEKSSLPRVKINRSLFEVPYEDVSLLSRIGEGGSEAVVYRADWKGRIVAFKVFKTNVMFKGQSEYDDFEKEVMLLSSLRHPNIIEFYGCSLKEPRVGIILEFCKNGTLSTYVQTNRGKLKFPEKCRILAETSFAIEYLHSRKCLHRDIKSDNILLTAALNPKIIDFGLSRLVQRANSQKTTRVGTRHYMAPEITLSSTYNEKVDVFSFSIVMFEFLEENYNPYGFGMENIELRVAQDPHLRPRMVDEKAFPKWIVQMMQRCWDAKPEKRLPFSQIAKIFLDKAEMRVQKDQKIRLSQEPFLKGWDGMK